MVKRADGWRQRHSANQRRGDLRPENAMADDSASPFHRRTVRARCLACRSAAKDRPSKSARRARSVYRTGCAAERREDMQEHYLVTAGAAAGLSAAFSAPLSGMMFALEGVHRSFSPAILMGATAASLTADFVSKYCFGLRPVLDFGDIGQLSLAEYVWLIPLGLVAGLVGSLMNRSLLGFQTLYGKLPAWSRPMIAIALALPIGIWLPDVLGGGSNLIAMAEHARVGLGMLCVLFVAKMLFTSTSFGSGAPGGIFMPILAVGSLAGGICGERRCTSSATCHPIPWRFSRCA